MYNNPTQFPLFLTPNPTHPNSNAVNIQQQQQQHSLPNPPNNNGYHTTNIMPPNIANNANQFTPTIPSYPSQMNQNQMYNAFNTQQLAPNPSNNMHFQPNLYPQSTTVGPPQFVTIVNKATNYITSSPYSLITPQHQHHHPHQHIPPQSQSQAPASPTSSTTSSKTNDTDNDLNIDAMLQHFGLTPTPHGEQLWQQCFENITYKHLSVPQTYSHNNQYLYEYEQDCQLDKEAKNKDINISICNKCTEDNTQTLSSNHISASPFLCSQDYYHNACFHFIFAIEGLGVFQYCNSCFPAKQTNKINVTVTENKQSIESKEVQPAPFKLDTYLNNLISQQLDIIHAEHENKNKTAQRCDIKLSIPELSAHCKQSGMTDSFIQQLKHNHKQNALPHSLIDLPVFNAPAVEVSIHSQAHIHCIIYHPKIGCMEFCQYCNKMRSTFCDNPGCLTKASVANVMLEANMDVSNQASFCSALHHLITSNIAPYKQTTLFTDINDTFSPLKSYMDLNKRLNLTMPKPAGPLAPHAMLITNRSHRNRSSSSTSLPKNLSADTNSSSTHKTASTKSHKSSDRSHKTTQSASFNQYKQYKHHHHGSRRQFYRYRYNKRRAANFNKLKKGIRKSEFITHNVICVTPTSSYQDSIHSSYGDDKCLSVPPLTPMLRANSANMAGQMMSINHGRPYSVHYTHNKVLQNRMNNYVEVANSVRSFDERSDAPSMTPVHSVHNGLNPAWSNPYATGSIGVRNGPHSFNDAASLSSLPMSPTFSYTSLPNFPPSPFVYSTSNISHHSTSSEHHSTSSLNPVDGLNHQYLRLNYLLNSNKEMCHSLNIHREKDKNKNKANHSEDKGKVNVVSPEEEKVNKTLENEQKASNVATNINDGTQNNMNAQMRYPMNLINVNSGGNLQTAPLQLKPPFIPLSTVPQYYTATNQAPLMGSNRMSSLGQLPQNIQLQLRQQGLPQNALILPIDQMENFKKMFAANKNNANFMANLNNRNVRDANFGNNMNNNGGSKLHRNARR